VSKIDQPVNTTERVLLAIPPMAQYEPGFGNSFQTIKKLIHQLGAKTIVMATDSNLTLLKPFIEKQDPELSAKYQILDDWNNITDSLNKEYESQDLIILFSSRRGTISWQPGFEQLPGKVIKQMNPDNFIIVYPALVEEHSAPTAVLRFDESPLLPDLSANHIYIAKDGESDIGEAIEKMIQPDSFPIVRMFPREYRKTESTVDPDNLPTDLPGCYAHTYEHTLCQTIRC
jgi:hypothetical protein